MQFKKYINWKTTQKKKERKSHNGNHWGQCICEISYLVQGIKLPHSSYFWFSSRFSVQNLKFLFSHLAFPIFSLMSWIYLCLFCLSFPLRSAKLVPCYGRWESRASCLRETPGDCVVPQGVAKPRDSWSACQRGQPRTRCSTLLHQGIQLMSLFTFRHLHTRVCCQKKTNEQKKKNKTKSCKSQSYPKSYNYFRLWPWKWAK